MKFVVFTVNFMVLFASTINTAVDYVTAKSTSYTGGYSSVAAVLDESKRSEMINQYYNTLKKPFNDTDLNIIGGEPAADNEFPWFGPAEIVFGTSTYSCGASLIYRDIAVTAAQCFVNDYLASPDTDWAITFNLGANNINGSDGTSIKVIEVVWPSKYDFPSNDIAYYILETPTDVDPVLYNTNTAFPTPGTIGTAIGFGYTSFNGTSGEASDILLKVDLPSISDVECDAAYIGPHSDSIACSFDPNKSKASCFGDGGGPIISTDGTVFGINSFTAISSCTDYPSGFTRTSYFDDFTSKVICDFSSSPPVGCKGFPPPCGLFGLSIFCPFTVGGIVGRWLRSIFGF